MIPPTRRAARADLPTAWGGEALQVIPPTRRAARADLPTAWGGERHK
jgi:hypothetical protein